MWKNNTYYYFLLLSIPNSTFLLVKAKTALREESKIYNIKENKRYEKRVLL